MQVRERHATGPFIAEGQDFAQSKHPGFLTAFPKDLGTGGLTAEVVMALRLLPDLPEFKMLAKSLRISAKRKLNDGVQFWAVQNAPAQLGASEVEQASLLAEAVRQFSALERRLDSGEDVSKYLAATLPSQRPPTAPRPTMVVEKSVSLEGSKAGGQKAVPKAILTPLATKLGVTEAMCKPGLDGALAGDAKCYTFFRRAFEPEMAASVASSSPRISPIST